MVYIKYSDTKKFNLGIIVEMFVVGSPDEFEIVYGITSSKRVNFYDASRRDTLFMSISHRMVPIQLL